MDPGVSSDVETSIARCADAVHDLDRLKVELVTLRTLEDTRAQFATALFDLERARRGDSEARASMLDVADSLLVFWREGTGVELAHLHPALEELWASAATLLVSFEKKRFAKALDACWNARTDAALLRVAVQDLRPDGNRRVEFARCLYSLELARMFDEPSRVEFAKRAGLLSEAYQSDDVARELVADDAGLKTLWTDVRPYLDEFFEQLEEAAARREAKERAATQAVPAVRRSEVRTDPLLPAAPPPSPRESSITQPGIEPVALAESREVPSFRTLVGEHITQEEAPHAAAAPTAPDPSAKPTAPPAPPPNLTPPGSWVPDDVIEAIEDPTPITETPLDSGPRLRPPPPPPDLTPPGSWRPGAGGDVELIDADEAPPPPPPRGPSLDVALEEDYEPDAPTIAYWNHTLQTLSLLPDSAEPRAAQRLLAADSRAERKKLNEYLESAQSYLHVPEARTFSALIRLMLAGQLKEKSLFGQPNARRREAFATAFSLLSADPRAAGHAAVWFSLDGAETEAALQKGLAVLQQFLGFCARSQLDPLEPAAQQAFLTEGTL